MYFACWLALLSAPSTHSQHFYHLAVWKLVCKILWKFPISLSFFVLSPGVFIVIVLAAGVVTGRSWRVMQHSEPESQLQPESRGGHWLWSPGCGHFGWREMGCDLFTHYPFQCRHSERSHLHSLPKWPHHVTKVWVWQSRGGGTDRGGARIRHNSVQKFRDRTQRSNNLPKGQPDI